MSNYRVQYIFLNRCGLCYIAVLEGEIENRLIKIRADNHDIVGCEFILPYGKKKGIVSHVCCVR